MCESAYFAISSFLLYTFWFASLGWFVPSPKQRQNSIYFWTRTTELHDMPRETLGQEYYKPVRRISYPRLLLALVICSSLFYGATVLPIKVEFQLVGVATVVAFTPLIVIFATYWQFPVRYIPLLWGYLIGFCAVGGFTVRANPFGVNQSIIVAVTSSISGLPYPRETVFGFLILVLPVTVGNLMAKSGCSKPFNWFAWCILTMVVGSICVAFGLWFFQLI